MDINIPEGYKKTEVGIILNDWEMYYISEIAKKITDGEHATPRRTTEGYYLLSARNIHNGRIDLTDVDFVGEDEYQRIRKRCNPEPDDIVISCSGTIGRVSVVPSGLECVMVRSAALIKPDKAKVNSYFIQYILQSRVGQTQILQSLNQGAQANLFLNHIEGLKIPLPPLPEQKAIAQSLSDVDALIAALDQLITKKRNIKQGMMQQLVTGKKRLPGFSGNWEAKTFKDISFVNQGLQIAIEKRLKQPVQNSKQYITIQFLNNAKDIEYINDYSHSVCCNEEDVLMTRTGNTGIVVSGVNGVFHNNFFKINFNRKIIDKNYLIGYLKLDKTQKIILSKAGTSTIPDLNHNDFYSIPIPIPSLSEQKAIAQVLSDMDAEIEALEQKRDKYKAIKQGMMQELLTGKTRLL